MCLFRSWKTGFLAMCKAAWLSQNSCIGYLGNTPNEASKARNQTSSLVVITIDLYSTSAEDRVTVACFLIFQEIGEAPSCIKYPVKDLLESGHVPQSESQKP